MIRTQIQLTEQQARLLRGIARKENRSLADVIRQFVDAGLSRLSPKRVDRYAAAAQLVGRFQDQQHAPDLSERHDDYLDDAFGGHKK